MLLIKYLITLGILSSPPASRKDAASTFNLIKFDLTEISGIKNFKGNINSRAKLPLLLVVAELKSTGLIKELTEFKGCYNNRNTRRPGGKESNIPSAHSYALACDFNTGPFSSEFVSVWEKYGWCWGGSWSNWKDKMHFSYTKFECRYLYIRELKYHDKK